MRIAANAKCQRQQVLVLALCLVANSVHVYDFSFCLQLWLYISYHYTLGSVDVAATEFITTRLASSGDMKNLVTSCDSLQQQVRRSKHVQSSV